jgi:O-methyltransferase/aklanonic acid methyltransferase
VTTDRDDIGRSYTRAVWNAIGDSYGEGVPMMVDMARALVERAALQPGDHVIDLGTGNGHALVPAATAVAPARVIGVDLSPTMLEAARRRVAAAGLTNVELHVMDCTTLSFADATFDVALASTVFQFVGYAPEALHEWRRVLADGGRLALSVPLPEQTMAPLYDLMRDYFERLPAELQAVWKHDGAAPGTERVPDLAQLCIDSGFTNATVDTINGSYNFPDVDAWWSFQWTHGSRTLLVALPEDALADMRADAETRLQPMLGPNGEVPASYEMQICIAHVSH